MQRKFIKNKLNEYERVLDMFMGGTIEQWIGVLEWLVLIIVLGIGTVIVSCILTNKVLHKNKRKKKFKYKKTEKKSYFVDVA